MSRFLATMLESASGAGGDARGMTTGEPREAVWRSWAQVHRAARGTADALRRPGADGGPALPFRGAVGVLAGEPAAIAPAAQAVWLCGGSVTMLHQPTARTDLAVWAEDTVTTLKMIDASMVLLGPPFDALAPVLTEQGVPFRMLDALDGDPAAVTAAADVADEDDTALLQLTSGSTATPKAVRITHANLRANIAAMVEASELDVDHDRMVSWLPLFHDMGMVGFLTVPMTVGLDLVTVTPADFLTRPRLWAELISRYRGTVTAAPNFAYAVLARQLSKVDDGELDLSSLRIAMNGAEPVDPAAVAAFTDAGSRFGLRPESVLCAYGMAETALGVSFAPVHTGLSVDRVDAESLEAHRRATPAGEGPTRAFPELGPPLPGLEVRVVGPAGRVLGPREVGGLHLRGASVTPGYLTVDGPVSTRDGDSWFDTGDEGYLTDSGAIVVCGRTKDVIIMGGRNIYPTDIERAAGEADGVRAGNVVAVRIEAGQGRHRESFAVAVEAKGADSTEATAAIRADVVRRIVSAVGVRPAEVAVLAPGSLPKTPSGKLRRAATADLLTSR